MIDIKIIVVGAQLTPALQAYVEQKLEVSLVLLSGVTEVTVDLRQGPVSRPGLSRPYLATVSVVTRERTFVVRVSRPGLYASFDEATKSLLRQVTLYATPKQVLTYPGDPTHFKLQTVLTSHR